MEWHKEFKILDTYTYLNTARFGPLPDRVIERQRFVTSHLRNEGSWNFDELIADYESTRLSVAELIGAGKDNIVFLPNSSIGINLCARYLGKTKVVLFKNDFPSVVLPWKLGTHSIKCLDYTDENLMSHLEDSFRDGCEILCISWIQSFDGFEIDLPSIFELCKMHDVILVLDGTQGLGAIPFQVDPSVSMVFLASGFKWLLAGYGISIGYISQDLIPFFKEFSGWNSISFLKGDLKEGAKSLEVGNANFEGVLGLSESLKMIKQR
ncbi:MAG: aminotransferase class V-fold PLP-dependent enzyme, partial [Proteobacteria bacterium]|nr:aminotransferase class V-fold PLP-dependent enzyme [Pseudomonadota bacterium]